MKKKILEMGMACLLLFGVFWLAREGARMVSVQREKDSFVVVVDPGHGGRDPGKIGKREGYQLADCPESEKEAGKRESTGGDDQRKRYGTGRGGESE